MLPCDSGEENGRFVAERIATEQQHSASEITNTRNSGASAESAVVSADIEHLSGGVIVPAESAALSADIIEHLSGGDASAETAVVHTQSEPRNTSQEIISMYTSLLK